MQAALAVRTANMALIKKFAEKHLKKDSPLRELIMAEPDRVPLDEYVSKMDVFYRLFERECPRY